MREHVVAASKAMKMGDWRTCHSFIINEKMNSKVWDLFPETQRVREMLVRLAYNIIIHPFVYFHILIIQWYPVAAVILDSVTRYVLMIPFIGRSKRSH